jgi:hypothetical protein
MESETSFNGYLLAFKSTLCSVKIRTEYDTIAAQFSRWLQGDVEELQISVGSTDTLWYAPGNVQPCGAFHQYRALTVTTTHSSASSFGRKLLSYGL